MSSSAGEILVFLPHHLLFRPLPYSVSQVQSSILHHPEPIRIIHKRSDGLNGWPTTPILHSSGGGKQGRGDEGRYQGDSTINTSTSKQQHKRQHWGRCRRRSSVRRGEKEKGKERREKVVTLVVHPDLIFNHLYKRVDIERNCCHLAVRKTITGWRGLRSRFCTTLLPPQGPS